MIKCHLNISPSKECYEICVQSKRCEALKMWKSDADRDYARSIFDAVPSAQPERKKGRWVTPNKGLCEADFIRCSLCGFLSHPMVVRWDMGLGLETIGKLELPYECPKCHANMRGEEE